MTLKGHIEDGQIVVDEPFELPNGSEVEIHVKDQSQPRRSKKSLDDFVGIIPSNIDVRDDYYMGQTNPGE